MNLLDYSIVLGLFIVIIAEFFFLQWVVESSNKEKERLLEELSKANKALIAKSANDYVMMTAMDKTAKEEPPKEPGEADSSELTDEEYDKMIAKINS